MYKIKVISSFSAAHFLREYEGKCESLHGHNWKVEAVVGSGVLDKAGMVMDFSELKKSLSPIVAELDHENLNDLEYFKQYNPSSENIARYIFCKLNGKVVKKDCKVLEVRVWETETSCAAYGG